MHFCFYLLITVPIMKSKLRNGILNNSVCVREILTCGVCQRIGRFLSVEKIKSIRYHDTVTFIREYIL